MRTGRVTYIETSSGILLGQVAALAAEGLTMTTGKQNIEAKKGEVHKTRDDFYDRVVAAIGLKRPLFIESQPVIVQDKNTNEFRAAQVAKNVHEGEKFVYVRFTADGKDRRVPIELVSHPAERYELEAKIAMAVGIPNGDEDDPDTSLENADDGAEEDEEDDENDEY